MARRLRAEDRSRFFVAGGDHGECVWDEWFFRIESVSTCLRNVGFRLLKDGFSESTCECGSERGMKPAGWMDANIM